MKRTLIITVAWLLGVFASCDTKTTERQVADEFMAFSDVQASFEPIKTIVKDKRIVILGEAGHADGKTFEIKSKLIEFLNANNEYDVVLEGMGFLDGAVLQGVLPPLCIDSNYLDVANAWYGLWSQTKEATPLVEAMCSGKVRYWGMDCNPSLGDYFLIPYLLASSPSVSSVLGGSAFDSLMAIHDRMMAMDTTLTHNDLDYFDSKMNQTRKALEEETDLEKKTILDMTIDNALAFLGQLRLGFTEWDAVNAGINIRDRQMAENVEWYLSRFPERKVIIWTANFHGAKKIDQIMYGKEPEPDLYKKFVLLGEHLEKAFPGKVYSLAFTSGGGSTGFFYANDSTAIVPDSISMEFQLSQRGMEYGFCDLSQKKDWADMVFNSIIFGDCKPGKWARAFDGVYFIKVNHKAHEVGM
jgi:erythromycin esterase